MLGENTLFGAEAGLTVLVWRSFASAGEPKGVQGGTKGNVSPVGYPPKAEMTRSSGKQQAERTAVRAAPIVCPEESPLLAASHGNFAVKESLAGGTDAPTTARTVGLPPRRGKYFLSARKKVPKKARGTATPEAAHVAMRRGLRSAGALRAVLDLGSLRSPAGKKPFIAHF